MRGIEKKEVNIFYSYIPPIKKIKEDILNLIEYFKKYPSRSAINNRLKLTAYAAKFYKLKSMKAHTALSESLLSKS